jgi:hypothetical protein
MFSSHFKLRHLTELFENTHIQNSQPLIISTHSTYLKIPLTPNVLLSRPIREFDKTTENLFCPFSFSLIYSSPLLIPFHLALSLVLNQQQFPFCSHEEKNSISSTADIIHLKLLLNLHFHRAARVFFSQFKMRIYFEQMANDSVVEFLNGRQVNFPISRFYFRHSTRANYDLRQSILSNYAREWQEDEIRREKEVRVRVNIWRARAELRVKRAGF